MREKFDRILTIVMGTSFGIWLGHSLYTFWDYKTNPVLYAMMSAPWYTSIVIYGAFAAVVLLVCAVIKWFLKRNKKNT